MRGLQNEVVRGLAKPITGRAITHEPIQPHPHSSNPPPPGRKRREKKQIQHHPQPTTSILGLKPTKQTHQLTKATTIVREGVMRKWVIGRGMGEKERANGDRCGGERGENKTETRKERVENEKDGERGERINFIKKIIQ